MTYPQCASDFTLVSVVGVKAGGGIQEKDNRYLDGFRSDTFENRDVEDLGGMAEQKNDFLFFPHIQRSWNIGQGSVSGTRKRESGQTQSWVRVVWIKREAMSWENQKFISFQTTTICSPPVCPLPAHASPLSHSACGLPLLALTSLPSLLLPPTPVKYLYFGN